MDSETRSFLRTFTTATELANMLCAYAIIGTVVNLFGIWSDVEKLATTRWFSIVIVLTLALQVTAVIYFRKRKNWARILLAVYAILALTGIEHLVQPISFEGILLALLVAVFNLFWLYLVFFTPVRSHFWGGELDVDSARLAAIPQFNSGAHEAEVGHSRLQIRAFLVGMTVFMVALSWLFSTRHPADLSGLQQDLSTQEKAAPSSIPAASQGVPDPILEQQNPLSEIQGPENAAPEGEPAPLPEKLDGSNKRGSGAGANTSGLGSKPAN